MSRGCTLRPLARSPRFCTGEHRLRDVDTAATVTRAALACLPIQVILMAGLQGVGKTTACGKLALYLQKQGKKARLLHVASQCCKYVRLVFVEGST